MKTQQRDDIHKGEGYGTSPDEEITTASGVSRRRFLIGAGSGTAAVAGFAAAQTVLAARPRQLPLFEPIADDYAVRVQAAGGYMGAAPPTQSSNGDEEEFADARASFFKTLPQDELGEVDPSAMQAMRRALDTGVAEHFDAITLSPRSARALANPQAAFAREMTGMAAAHTSMLAAPKFTGPLQAAEMGELYWQALTRDIAFRTYESDPDILAASQDLNGFSATVGPTSDGSITPSTLFRGETPGDLAGPYISQFLWLPASFGHTTLNTPAIFPVAGEDFGIDYVQWLAMQHGVVPTLSLLPDPTPRYIFNNRALGDFVHSDVSFQAYLTAALVALEFGPDAIDSNNPYLGSDNQFGFVSFGVADIIGLVASAARVALTGAWYQKWRVHRRLRPEVFGGRIENQARGRKHYGIHPEVMLCEAVERVQSLNGSRLLPLAYPEGSPTHPSFPAGHATIAGACVTILKAFFNEDFVIPVPVQASADGTVLDTWNGADLTLGNEFNKLANNIAFGRNAAGVHYRSDGVYGLEVGEQQAIGILKDYSLTYSERFAGFQFTRFDGVPITIVDGAASIDAAPHRARAVSHKRTLREHP